MRKQIFSLLVENTAGVTSHISGLFSRRGYNIDSFSSGKRHVTRHANLFAILFDIADGARCDQLYESVIANDAITQITTPYLLLL